MRKYYVTLLHRYEQAYFFKMGASVVPPAQVSLSVKSPLPHPKQWEVAESVTIDQDEQMSKRRRSTNTLSQEEAAASTNVPVVGVIEGKFDYGYLVSVRLGSKVLRGILYRPAAPEVKSGSTTTGVNGSGGLVSGDIRRRRKRRRRDPHHPKPNRSAYNFFFKEKHSKLKALYPQREREFSKMIGESWNKLNDDERKIYQARGLNDKERYKREMEEYRDRLKLLHPMDHGTSERTTMQQRRQPATPCAAGADHVPTAAPSILPTMPPTDVCMMAVDEKSARERSVALQ